MQSQLLTDEPSPELFEQWAVLHHRAGRYPFTDPSFFRAWWQHIGRRAEQKLHIVTVADGGDLVAIAPHVVVRRKGLRILRWAGIDEFCYGDALVDGPEAERVLWHAVRRTGCYDFAVVSRVADDCRTYAALAQFSRRVRTDFNYVLDVTWPSSETWILQSLSSHARKHYRNMENQIRARAALIFHVDPSGALLDKALTALVDQKVSWAAARDMPGLFQDKGSAFGVVRHLAEAAASNGTLFVSCLEAGGEIIAAMLGMLHGNSLYLIFIAYDPAWAKQSPGRLLLFKTLAHAIDQGITRVDLMNGGQEYKKQLAQLNQHELVDFTFPGSVIGRVIEPVLARIYF